MSTMQFIANSARCYSGGRFKGSDSKDDKENRDIAKRCPEAEDNSRKHNQRGDGNLARIVRVTPAKRLNEKILPLRQAQVRISPAGSRKTAQRRDPSALLRISPAVLRLRRRSAQDDTA